jgi:hypothetical protein
MKDETLETLGGDPFGTTDGYGTAGQDPLDSFVSFGKPGWQRGVAMRSDDRGVRVIVGRKGAGKSIYLRRLQAAADVEGSLYADDIQTSYPRTHHIIKVGRFWPDWNRVERWSALWRAAILRAMVAHLVSKRSLAEAIGPENELELREEYKDLYPEIRKPRSIYGQLSDIIYYYEKQRALDRYLDHPQWADLEYQLGDILPKARPICFYVDAIDEKFAQAPRWWRDAQLGLFYQVMNFLQDTRVAGGSTS